jgi:hypothetical protein
MADQKIHLTELEEKLAGDKSKTELTKLYADLDKYIADAKKALDGGLPPEDFRNISKYRASLEAARNEVAPMVWALSVNL